MPRSPGRSTRHSVYCHSLKKRQALRDGMLVGPLSRAGILLGEAQLPESSCGREHTRRLMRRSRRTLLPVEVVATRSGVNEARFPWRLCIRGLSVLQVPAVVIACTQCAHAALYEGHSAAQETRSHEFRPVPTEHSISSGGPACCVNSIERSRRFPWCCSEALRSSW